MGLLVMVQLMIVHALASGPIPLLERARFVRSGDAGDDGVDEALGITFDDESNITVVGYLDGEPGHGTDAFAVRLTDDEVAWVQRWDSGQVGLDRVDSNDQLRAVAAYDEDVIAFCGRFGGRGTHDEPNGYHWLHVADVGGDGWDERWSWTMQDGPESSEQSCDSIAWSTTNLVAVGSSRRPETGGGWWMHQLPGLGYKPSAPTTIRYSDGLFGSPYERTRQVVADSRTGSFVVLGDVARGDTAETGFMVRSYDAKPQLEWDSSYATAEFAQVSSMALAPDGGVILAYPNYVAHTRLHTGYSGENWRHVASPGSALASSGQTVWAAAARPTGSTRVIVVHGFDVFSGAMTHYMGGTTTSEQFRVWAAAAHDDVVALAGSLPGADGTPDFGVLILEADDDFDGVVNSHDECPRDPGKQVAGICGCGLSDVGDADGDSVLDCVDRCAEDPQKWDDTGICGCGVPDVDSDLDGWFDCEEECPADAEKRRPGTCGCGVTDLDSDQDDLADCVDPCRSLAGPPDQDGECRGTHPGCACTNATGTHGWLVLFVVLGRMSRRGLQRGSVPMVVDA